MIIWDGGNNDFPFYKPDIHITLVDSLRPMDEAHYYPGEINVRMADMVVINKVNELPSLKKAHEHAEHLKPLLAKPNTPVFFGKSVISPDTKDPHLAEWMNGKRLLVIDDGPTLTHGGMAYGAGYVLAKQLGAAEIVDPRPYAQGSLVDTFKKFPHLKNCLPAMGYDEAQVKDLEATIKATPCDGIVIGTPSDITHLFDVNKPCIMAKYELELVPNHEEEFKGFLDTFYNKFSLHHHEDDLIQKWAEKVSVGTHVKGKEEEMGGF